MIFPNECKTHDLKSAQEMALAEMFVDGFDYKSLVRKTLKAPSPTGAGFIRKAKDVGRRNQGTPG